MITDFALLPTAIPAMTPGAAPAISGPSTLQTSAGATGPASSALPPTVVVLLIVAAALGVMLFVSRRRRMDPADRAFLALTTRAGLDRRDRARLRSLCRTSNDPHPVALVLSRSAFRRVAKRADRRVARTLPPLEVKLFGHPAPDPLYKTIAGTPAPQDQPARPSSGGPERPGLSVVA